jgi:hypothetical protein
MGFIAGTEVGFRSIPPEVLVTMPSTYQLFPHALNSWLVGPDGAPLDRDVFDVEIWRRFQWAIFDPVVRARVAAQYPDRAEGEARLALLERYFERRLERARRFTWSLSVAEEGEGARPIVLGGDCELTPARLVVEEEGGDSTLRLWPEAGEGARARRGLRRADARARRWHGDQGFAARARVARPDRPAARLEPLPPELFVLPVRAARPAHRQPELPGQPAAGPVERGLRRRLWFD